MKDNSILPDTQLTDTTRGFDWGVTNVFTTPMAARETTAAIPALEPTAAIPAPDDHVGIPVGDGDAETPTPEAKAETPDDHAGIPAPPARNALAELQYAVKLFSDDPEMLARAVAKISGAQEAAINKALTSTPTPPPQPVELHDRAEAFVMRDGGPVTRLLKDAGYATANK